MELQEQFPEFHKHAPILVKPLTLRHLIQKHQVAILNLVPHHRSVSLFGPLRKSGIKILDLMGHTDLEAKPAIGLCEIFAEDVKHNYVVQVPQPAIIPVILALAPFTNTKHCYR